MFAYSVVYQVLLGCRTTNASAIDIALFNHI